MRWGLCQKVNEHTASFTEKVLLKKKKKASWTKLCAYGHSYSIPSWNLCTTISNQQKTAHRLALGVALPKKTQNLLNKNLHKMVILCIWDQRGMFWRSRFLSSSWKLQEKKLIMRKELGNEGERDKVKGLVLSKRQHTSSSETRENYTGETCKYICRKRCWQLE